MKKLLFVFAVVVATVQCVAGVSQESVKIFHQCMRELGIKSFQSKEFREKFVCINLCESEKAGLVVNGKYLEDKYIDSYKSNFPKAGSEQVSITRDCVREANKQIDKCDVERALQDCLMKSHDFLFNEALLGRLEESNEALDS